MRDEIDARMWNAHHDGLVDLIDDAFRSLRAAIARLPTWDGTSQHLFALVASFAITALTFNTTAV